MKNVQLKNMLYIALVAISMLSSCSKEDSIVIQEDGNAPNIEFKISYNGATYTLSSQEDYTQKYLNLPFGEDLSFDLKVSDNGGIDEVNYRIVRFEHDIISYSTTPSGWSTEEVGNYHHYNYVHPNLGEDITEFTGLGTWETGETAIVYFQAFDREFLITAADRTGHTSEIRIQVERSSDDNVGFHEK